MPDKKDQKPPRKIDADAFEREVTTDLDEETPDKPKGFALHTRILIGLAVGVIAGVVVNRVFGSDHARVSWVVSNITEPIGAMFLRLLLLVVVPLVFSSLVVGVAGIGDVRKLGRVGLKTLAYTIIISAISVAIGLTLANTIQPGKRVDPATAAALQQRYSSDATKRVDDAKKASENKDSALMVVVKTLIPSNPMASIVGIKPGEEKQTDTPDMLHLMFFSVLLGIAATLIPTSVSGPFLRGLQGLFEISAKIIDIIMKLAPYAVAC
ncbi:MAG: cation:dicarboxylase symporter family transporter, partial [Acidobacteria bacterium]|nr:cation:dicarboxylase symporter family transporter [Acidobacteriota bacterium]